ncbi:prepilin-type N-terminal cleavage/methylation domain-containing protein [Candidatus Azambacteria bacterium]|nr:prepilin-type N-terminal cleavage/methylation domain-containing protein [Candidatus Azambacteria bacterium]
MERETENKKADAQCFNRSLLLRAPRFRIQDSRSMFHVSRFTFHERGFTLIEVLVAVAVIAVVSALVFANVGSKQKNISRSTQKLALDIRQAQNLSLAPSDSPICIYGVRIIDATQYFHYSKPSCADYNGYQYGDGVGAVSTPSSSLESGVTFASFGQDIAFEAPEPITYLNGATGTAPMVIMLQSSTGAKSVSINRFGRVEIQ